MPSVRSTRNQPHARRSRLSDMKMFARRGVANSPLPDRLWLQQEDQVHDALGPQGLHRQQRQRRRAPPDAQPDPRRRVRFPSEYNLELQGSSRDSPRTIANSVAGSPTPSPRGRGSTSSAARSSWASRSPTPRRRSRRRYKRNAGVTVRSRRGVQLSETGWGEDDDDGDGGGWRKREKIRDCYLGPAVFFQTRRGVFFHVASIGMHIRK